MQKKTRFSVYNPKGKKRKRESQHNNPEFKFRFEKGPGDLEIGSRVIHSHCLLRDKTMLNSKMLIDRNGESIHTKGSYTLGAIQF